MLEVLQRTSTRMINDFENRIYKMSLREMGIYLVEVIFLRGDVIQICNIFLFPDLLRRVNFS